LHPRMFNFPLRWWRSIQTLAIEEQKAICFHLVAYIFDHVSPGIQFGDADEVWHTIAKDVANNQRRSKKSAACRLEKEKMKDKEAALSALSDEEKEILKEKDLLAQEFVVKLLAKYPNVARMEATMTYDEYLKILCKWPNSLVKLKLAQMNAWSGLKTKVNAYKTCITWLQVEKKDLEAQGRWNVYEAEIAYQQKEIEKYIRLINKLK